MNTHHKIKNLIISTRPKTLMVGAAPVVLGSAHALHDSSNFSLLIFFLTLVCALLLQMGTNLVNEYFDFTTGVDTLERVGPKRSLLSGELTPNDLKIFFSLCFTLSLLLGIYLMYIGGLPIIIVGLLSILIAYCYTGGPLPLSHYYLGEVLAFIFFGPVAVIGTYYLQTTTTTTPIILASFVPGFISAALMSLNNLRDIKTDKKTSKKTIAIFIGEQRARYLTVFLGLCPIIISIVIIKNHLMASLLLPPILFIPLWKKILSEKKMTELNNGIAMFGKYNIVYCLLLSLQTITKW